jgi:hypothetical protein
MNLKHESPTLCLVKKYFISYRVRIVGRGSTEKITRERLYRMAGLG